MDPPTHCSRFTAHHPRHIRLYDHLLHSCLEWDTCSTGPEPPLLLLLHLSYVLGHSILLPVQLPAHIPLYAHGHILASGMARDATSRTYRLPHLDSDVPRPRYRRVLGFTLLRRLVSHRVHSMVKCTMPRLHPSPRLTQQGAMEAQK